MNTQLTPSEIQQIQQILKDEPAQKALSTLELRHRLLSRRKQH